MILENTKVERKTTVKYLGMYVDENLKWHNHIAYVVYTISWNLGVIYRAKYLLTSRELTLLYNTLILPHLNYCAVMWGRNYDSNTERIMLLQKRTVRIIDKKTFFLYPSSELFVKHKILKFHDIVKEQSIMILLAHVNNTLPSPISKLFEYEEHKNTRSVKHFVTPLALRNYYERGRRPSEFSLNMRIFSSWATRPTDRDAFQRLISFEPSYRLTNGFRHLKATFNKSFVLA